jgi:hypothetical protein
MAGYLTIDELKELTFAPDVVVDRVPTVWLDAMLESKSRWIDSRLRKRYAVPFTTPPSVVKLWLARIVTPAIYLRDGVPPSDEQFVTMAEDQEAAEAEIQEAANAEGGLFDLPVAGGSESDITKGGPLGYSEASPYVHQDVQARIGRAEDAMGDGTYG